MYRMYVIKEYPFKMQVACMKCADKGYINKKCPACNGRGLHNNTFSVWKPSPKLIEIDKIDRCSTTGEIRYWTDADCYYKEDDKLIHFSEKDADHECTRRNKEKYGSEFYSQYLNKNNESEEN